MQARVALPAADPPDNAPDIQRRRPDLAATSAYVLRKRPLSKIPPIPSRLSRARADVLSGLVVAIPLIPEAIGLSVIAGVDPKVGLYASVVIAIVISVVGGRPAMISAATAATAVVMTRLVKEHGVEYLFAATILMGVFQIVAGLLKLGRLMRFVSQSVMTGFVKALAILILAAQAGLALPRTSATRTRPVTSSRKVSGLMPTMALRVFGSGTSSRCLRPAWTIRTASRLTAWIARSTACGMRLAPIARISRSKREIASAATCAVMSIRRSRRWTWLAARGPKQQAPRNPWAGGASPGGARGLLLLGSTERLNHSTGHA